MNQLVITGAFPAATTTFVTREVAAVRDSGHEVVVLASANGDQAGRDLARQLWVDHCPVIYSDFRTAPVFSAGLNRFSREFRTAAAKNTYGTLLAERRKSYFSRVLKALSCHRVDLIHAHFVEWAYDVALPLSRLLGVPFTLTAHDGHLESYPAHVLRELQEQAEQVCLVSGGWKRLWGKKTKASDKLTVIHNGVDTRSLTTMERGPDRPEEIRIAVVSRLVPLKRVEDAVHAVSRLDACGLPCRLDILGDGPEDSSLKALCDSLGVTHKVRFHGMRPHSDVCRRLVSNTDIFLHCSERESFGIVMVEAMAAGLPVVAAASDGAREIVLDEKTGLLYPPGDLDALETCLTDLCRNREKRERFAREGQKRAQDKFSWERHMDEMMSMWNGVLAGFHG